MTCPVSRWAVLLAQAIKPRIAHISARAPGARLVSIRGGWELWRSPSCCVNSDSNVV